ncbi:MAG: 16S rRNA (cytosine(1402)-N(4))-methyltransferase RsmH [Candidatus Nealsonbacteria bacterium]|nr:16S rRNA (cytosine(1402)-N(4))-methyltransferase RsmH [Candidatus Nealsonbacteria bacterium]
MHVPVLKKEVLEYLDPKANENFVDCTIGEAGHAKEILERIKPNGKVLGIDADIKMIEKISKQDRLILVCDNYSNLKDIVEKRDFYPINGILIDLGMSSWHVDDSKKGFSFLKDEPLDMRYGSNNLTAEMIVNEYSKEELENIFKNYGEERYAERIAENISLKRKLRPIKTTFDLVEIIKQSIPSKFQRARINPATRVFQAIRIAVNDELNSIEKALPIAIEVLAKDGRLAVISFHSLEDRIVKNCFKEQSGLKKIEILTKKPITPSEEEIRANPRSRSAKLRVIEKI